MTSFCKLWKHVQPLQLIHIELGVNFSGKHQKLLFASLLIVPFLDLPDYKYGCQQDRTVKNGNGTQGKYPVHSCTIAQPLDGAPIIRNLTRDLEYARTVADYMKRNATSSPEEDGIVSFRSA